MNDAPNYDRRAARMCFQLGLKPRNAWQPPAPPKRVRRAATRGGYLSTPEAMDAYLSGRPMSSDDY